MSLTCIVTAFAAESRVFIDALRLRQVQARGLRLYAGECYLLLQTGPGKLAAAAATAALLQSRADVSLVVNAGVAGSATDIGSVHLAHLVRDTATGMGWYPHLPPQRTVDRLPTGCVHTCDTPQCGYESGILFDMEAAGVFAAASNYLPNDAVHSVKVISDNIDHPFEQLDAATAGKLMSTCVPVVVRVSQWHAAMARQDDSEHRINSFCERVRSRIHHSVSDTHQLKRLVQAYHTLAGELPDDRVYQQLSSSRDVRLCLQHHLQDIPFSYGS